MARTCTFFGYATCSTCRTAKKALQKLGIGLVERGVTERPPNEAELRDLWQRSGLPLKKFFNTSGLSYRLLSARMKIDALSDDEKLRLLARDGKLLKRPIVDDGQRVFVGFDPGAYALAFGSLE